MLVVIEMCVMSLPDSDGDGDVREGLRTARVVDNIPDDASLQQLPLAIGNVVGEVHFGCPVGHVHLTRIANTRIY